MLNLQHLDKADYRRAFTLFRVDMLPSAVTESKYNRQLFEERVCLCRTGKLELREHILSVNFINISELLM